MSKKYKKTHRTDNRKNTAKKVVKYRTRTNIAIPIFALVIIYVIAFVSIYLSKSEVQTYEVQTGTLTTNASFTGIAIREEMVFNSEYAGNINYYQREGSRVKVGDTLYTVDETGRVAQILEQYNSGENSLSAQSLESIRLRLNNFKTNYDGSNFDDVYDLKTDINATILQAMNENIMNNLESIIESTGSKNLFRTITTVNSGVVAYYVDGYENLTCEGVNQDHFNTDKYTKTNLKSEKLIVANNPAYKLITSEKWYIMFPLTQNEITKYGLADKNTVSLKFKKDNISTTASFSIVTNNDKTYGKISLNKYMIRYSTDRYLDIEIGTSSNIGLKIPASAVVEKEFYSIPKEYLTTGGNSNSYGFICETYDTSGQISTKFVNADIYKSTDTVCYVNKDDFVQGSNIVMPDSSKRYTIGTVEKLKGVYCINTGYTVFKLIDIYDQNNEYYISKKGISYGISVYDRILLDAANYVDGQMIY